MPCIYLRFKLVQEEEEDEKLIQDCCEWMRECEEDVNIIGKMLCA